MRIVAISDTHCSLHQVPVPDGDVLIHAGDGTFRGNVEEVSTWFSDMGKLPHRVKIAICGNHDWLGEREPKRVYELAGQNNIVYLQDEWVLLDPKTLKTTKEGKRAGKLLIYGSPWQPEFNNWAFNLSRFDHSLEEKWANIPKETDILVTHGPPQHCLDRIPGVSGLGCYDLAERIKALKEDGSPLGLHIFGHVHASYGWERSLEGILRVNAAIMTEDYEPARKPIVIDWDGKSFKIA